jgi:RNA polymerase sigma factor (sigma-70 family)
VTPLLTQRPRADRAFERLYRKHVHAVYRYSLAVLHNQADAEDVTQITFMSAYRAFSRGERPQLAHNWLIKIAHNVCRQRFRESARRPQEVALPEHDTMAAPEPDGDVPTAEEIRRALGFLSFNQRAALVMRELEGRSYAEIGEVLSLSVAAVETLLFRARRALREQLSGDLTCEQAELTLSQLQERRLTNAERGTLRAHLRECKDCAALERRQRAQRAAVKGLATIPLPSSLRRSAAQASGQRLRPCSRRASSAQGSGTRRSRMPGRRRRTRTARRCRPSPRTRSSPPSTGSPVVAPPRASSPNSAGAGLSESEATEAQFPARRPATS